MAKIKLSLWNCINIHQPWCIVYYKRKILMRLIQKEFLTRSILVTMQYCMSLTFVFYSFTLFRILWIDLFTNINSDNPDRVTSVHINKRNGWIRIGAASYRRNASRYFSSSHLILLCCARVMREISLAWNGWWRFAMETLRRVSERKTLSSARIYCLERIDPFDASHGAFARSARLS